MHNLENKIENVARLIKAFEYNPNGYCHLTTASGIYLKSVVEALQDIQTRQILDATTKADSLLLDIIASNIHPSF